MPTTTTTATAVAASNYYGHFDYCYDYHDDYCYNYYDCDYDYQSTKRGADSGLRPAPLLRHVRSIVDYIDWHCLMILQCQTQITPTKTATTTMMTASACNYYDCKYDYCYNYHDCYDYCYDYRNDYCDNCYKCGGSCNRGSSGSSMW